MSNFLAIATVTETVRQMLDDSVRNDVNGAIATAVRPNVTNIGSGGLPPIGVNIYLYQVSPNAAWRNTDLPTRREDGSLAQRSRVALDIHYLLSFYGDESYMEPQRILGSVVRTLHTIPVLTRKRIQDTVSAASFLTTSNLADEAELVKFTPAALSLEELSKLWSVFFQTPYVLSVAYQGSVVLIENEETPRASLPVRERSIYVMPFRQPLIEQVTSHAGASQPITAGSTLLIRGQRLRGDVTRVRIGEVEITPASQDLSDTQTSLQLSSPPFPQDSLRAGVNGVQVVHEILMGTPPVAHRGIESNLVAFVLHPKITPVSATSTQVILQVNPIVSKKQRVVLLLNENTTIEPKGYTFVDELRSADTNSIEIPISGVKAADYFMRLQVDGAESPLDLDPASPTFGPMVTIP